MVTHPRTALRASLFRAGTAREAAPLPLMAVPLEEPLLPERPALPLLGAPTLPGHPALSAVLREKKPFRKKGCFLSDS